jgi:hypothetical protein
MENDKLSIGLMTSTNLSNRYNACKSTWIKDFDNTYLFGGYIKDTNLIMIESASEDWNSAFLKQQLGLKYMYEQNPNNDWYNISGCDNVLYKSNIVKYLSNFNPNEDLLIGQAGDVWVDRPHLYKPDNLNLNNKYYRSKTVGNVNGCVSFQMLCGGATFFISRSLMSKLYQHIEQFNIEWKSISGHYYGSSDLALSYMTKKYCGVDLTHSNYMFSQPPTHYELERDMYDYDVVECGKNPLSYHYIKPDEMKEIYDRYK